MIKSFFKHLNISFILYIGFLVIVFALIFTKLFVVKSIKIEENKFYLAKIEKEDLFSLYKDKTIKLSIHDRDSVKPYGKKSKDGYLNFYPFNFLEIEDKRKKYIYQLIPKTKEDFKLDLRGNKFEILGGEALKNGKFIINSVVNFNGEKDPIFLILPDNKKLNNSTKSIYIVSLGDKCSQVYLEKDKLTKKKIPILFHEPERYLSDELISQKIKPLKIYPNSLIYCKNMNFTLNISLIDKVISVKRGKEYILSNAKHLRIRKGNITDDIDRLVQVFSNIYIECKKGKLFINPTVIKAKNNKIAVAGEKNLLGVFNLNPEFPLKYPKVYTSKRFCEKNKEISKNLPIRYPPRGLYISDKEAEVLQKDSFGKFKKSFESLKDAPPVYLKNLFTGSFISSYSSANKSEFKIISQNKNIKISADGYITVKQDNKLIYKDKEDIKFMYDSFRIIRNIKIIPNKEFYVYVNHREFVPKCGDIFISSKKLPLEYTFQYSKSKKTFNIRKFKDYYIYSINPKFLSFFKSYNIVIYTNSPITVRKLDNGKKIRIVRRLKINYHPPLACDLYKEKHLTSVPLENFSRVLKRKKTNNIIQSADQLDIPLELTPILGNVYLSKFGIGLIGKGYNPKDLTIDIDFSRDIVKILDGEIAVLSKDRYIQKLLKRYNENIQAGVVVLRAKDRKIIGVASYPYPKDNNFKKYLYLDKLNRKLSPLQNRAFYLEAHPGSTFKILTSIAALEEGIITKFKNRFRHLEGVSDLYGVDFEGKENISFHLRNFRNETTIRADFKTAFAHSYNVYFGYLALLLNKKLREGKKYTNNLFPVYMDFNKRKDEFKLFDYALKIGFNSDKGMLKGNRFPEFFISSKQIADSGIGQFEIMATPLQIATLTGIVYDGNLIKPSFLKDEKPKVEKNFLSSKFLLFFKKPTNRSLIEDAMRMVITEGTGKNAFKNFKFKDKIIVYGKTGTSQKGKRGLSDGWFTAYTKNLGEDDIIVTCLITNSGTGGSYCGRVVRKIIEDWVARNMKKINH